MRLLFLTQIIPYPPDSGPRIKTWHVLRYLAQEGHRVTLASYVRPDEEAYVPVLKQVCEQVYTAPIQRSRARDAYYLLRSFLSGRPFLIERDDLPNMRSLVNRLLREETFDYALADQLTMTQFLLDENREGKPRIIFDAHNAVWTIVERMKHSVPWLLKPATYIEAQRVKHYEGVLTREFDHTLAVTDVDRQYLLEAVQEVDQSAVAACAEKITVIPISVDTQLLQPIQRNLGSKNILTLGTLHYPPNADGIRWFIQEVFPRIRREEPQVNLVIVGKNPPRDFVQFAAENPQNVKVTGYVPDLKPYLADAALLVIPVRAGSGMRVRILEALAEGMPVVTTTIGLEGIEAAPGEDVLVADTPSAFAEAVLALLRNKALQDKLAQNSRRLAEARYDWRVVLKKLDEVIH
ncbi:MAG: glycosyltransferase family 4 protein [Anaerolineales bacterium]|nr:glycosyltransferase family 4 protein [Anaerolineales bacterium]